MGSTYEAGPVTVNRWAGPLADRGAAGPHRYDVTTAAGGPLTGLTRAELAELGVWIVAELASPHPSD